MLLQRYFPLYSYILDVAHSFLNRIMIGITLNLTKYLNVAMIKLKLKFLIRVEQCQKVRVRKFWQQQICTVF